MKKIILAGLLMMAFVAQLEAKPIAWHMSGTIGIGKVKKNCDGIWLCFRISKVGLGDELSLYQGNPSGELHGIGLGVDGKLYLVISESLLQKNQSDKLALLRGQSTYFLDEDETIPQSLLDAIHYRGSGLIKAGDKTITYENGYYFVQLN